MNWAPAGGEVTEVGYVPNMTGLGASTGWLATPRLDRLIASIERHPVAYTRCLDSEIDGG